jgi:cytochrome P450
MTDGKTVSGSRQALKNFIFSDGTQVMKGDRACVPARAMLRDETYFPTASNFDEFRFAPRDKVPSSLDMVSQPEGPSRYTDVSAHYHAWGIEGIIW